MRTIYLLVLTTVFMTACAGNPPAWWNPNNRYGTSQEQTGDNTQTATAQKTSVVNEENLDALPDYSYEEITLTPMPDEDGENISGVSASQNAELTPDAALPAPSVLN